VVLKVLAYVLPFFHVSYQMNYSKILLIWLTQDQACAELSNILYYQMLHILTYILNK
jgi:hypothetical protein